MRKRNAVGLGVAASVAGVALSFWAAAALGLSGQLDTSFSGDGRVTTSFSSSVDTGQAMAIQADGKIVVVGSVDISDGFAIARYNTDGTLDTSSDITPGTNFSGDGVTTIGVATEGNFAEALAVAIQPTDQKIVVAGSGFNDDPGDGSEDFALARLNTNGSLDTTGFGGGDGTLMTQFAPGPDDTSYNNDRAEAVAVQTDGDIVAAGTGDPTINAAGNEEDFAVARYNSDGVLDSGFGGDGRVTTDIFGDSTDLGHGLALLPGNKVLVVGSAQGTSSSALALTQYEEDGDPDPTFDDNGIRSRNFTGLVDELHAVVRQSDGKLVTVGRTGDLFLVARFNANGSDDNSFDGNGYVTTTFNSSSYDQVWKGVGLASDGKILTAGQAFRAIGYEFAVGRFFANGAVDRNWNPCSGATATDFGGDSDGAEGMAIDSSGRLVAAGGAGLDFGVARYQTTGTKECVPPNTTIQGPRRTRKRRPVYRLISTEAGSTFRCRINGRGTSKPFNPCSSPFKMPRLPLGPTRFEVKAIDKAGNADPSPAFLKIKRIPRRR